MSRDNDNGNDEEYYDEDQQYYNHKEIEAQFYSDGEDYDNTADPNEREAHLTGMMNDIDGAIDSRRRENEELGDQNGQLEGHEDRIAVLEANKAALALERLYAAQEAACGQNSGWDEEAGEWRDFREADYEAEGMTPPPVEDQGEGESDMDIDEDSD